MPSTMMSINQPRCLIATCCSLVREMNGTPSTLLNNDMLLVVVRSPNERGVGLALSCNHLRAIMLASPAQLLPKFA
jgi:hypothetical protein